MARSCEYSNKPSGFIKWWNFMIISTTVTFSRKTLLNDVIYDVTRVVSLREGNGVRKQFLGKYSEPRWVKQVDSL
jgi:hypothetical protein